MGTARARWSAWAWTAAALAVATLLPLLRHRGTPSWQLLHGEDGWTYTAEAVTDGRADVLFRGYAGYLQLPSRLIVGLATLVAREQLASVVALASTLVVALLALFVYRASEEWIASRPLRVTIAAALCLMPVVGYENTANAANLTWMFAAAVPWAFLYWRATRWQLVASASIVALGAMATALTVLYLPLAAAVLHRRRDRATCSVMAAFGAGLAVQAVVVLSTRQGERFPSHAGDVIELTASRVFATALLGDQGVDALWDARVVVLIASVALIVAAWISLIRRAPSSSAWAGAWFGLLTLATFLLPVVLRGTEYLLLFGDARPGTGSLRYSVVPVFLLISSFALLVSPAAEAHRRPWRKVAELVMIGQLAITSVLCFSTGPGENFEWRPEVERALRLCDDADDTTMVEVRLHPVGTYVPLTCGALTGW